MEWLRYASTQVDKHNGTTISRDRFFSFTGWPADLRGVREMPESQGVRESK